ncbi:hybrid sensor histidine kinase/response regulator [Almyronema epifaneia]|uniref:histidine kinase n=1 Tax=Almyronema epifaneia S1 TaxID=2991925 RepID=A0ABW6IJF2_9CYAN
MSRLLLLFQQKENRRLLSQWLAENYQLVAPSLDTDSEAISALSASDFDLCILDGTAFSQLEPWLKNQRQAAEPVFWPCVLLIARSDVNLATRQLWQSVDDLLTTPLEKIELQARLEVLLRARQFSRQLQQANLELQQADEMKSRFVSILTHEFRNPLNVVSGFVQLLERSQNDPAKQAFMLQRIRHSIGKLNELVEGALVYSRADVGKLKFEPGICHLTEFCQQLVADFKLSCSTPPHLYLELPEAVPPVYLDETLLHHILSNLLSNAVKYSSPESPVHLRVHFQPNQVVFEIQDQGIGIPLIDQPDLFESFHRASNAKEIAGTGLGLSIVKQCVDRHGGQITFESQPDVGTLFTVCLPAAYEQIDFDFQHH